MTVLISYLVCLGIFVTGLYIGYELGMSKNPALPDNDETQFPFNDYDQEWMP